MKNKLYLFFSVLIVGLALCLRLYKMENRAPFDWDQNRDYKAIAEIASGKYTLIGPVAKGEGGFFLGPLYYYLAIPAYLLMDGSPLALPVTSVVLDVLTIVAILVLLRRILGDWLALWLATIWSFSWFTIEMSRISWNVALIPVWSAFILWIFTQKDPLSITRVWLLGIMVGLSWHIHAALIPIVIAIALFLWKTWARDWKHIISFILGYSIPLFPLLIFDLRHAWLNWHLLTQMFIINSHPTTPPPKLLQVIMMALGKNTQNILLVTSGYQLALGYTVSLIALLALIFSRNIYRLSGLIIFINILSIFILREIRFPEYYFAMSYLPTLILLFGTVVFIAKNNHIFLIIITLFSIFQNIQKYSIVETSFSLSRKISTAKLMRSLNAPIDLQFIMAPGREGGIKTFYALYGGILQSDSETKIVVTENDKDHIIESALLIGKFGDLRVFKVVVQ